MNDYPPLKKYVILRAAYEETGYLEVVLKESLNLLII